MHVPQVFPVKLTLVPSEWHTLCEALSTNSTLTNLNLNNNKLGPNGVRVAAKALRGCVALKRLGFSYNEPGVGPALTALPVIRRALTALPASARCSIAWNSSSRAFDDVCRRWRSDGILARCLARTLAWLVPVGNVTTP